MSIKNKKVVVSDFSSEDDDSSSDESVDLKNKNAILNKKKVKIGDVREVISDHVSGVVVDKIINELEQILILRQKRGIGKTGRPVKEKHYAEERKEVILKMSKILGFEGTSGIVYINEITEKKQKKMFELIDDVKKYFGYARWSFFQKINDDNSWILLVKSLYRSMGYNIKQNIKYKKKKDGECEKIPSMTIIKEN